MHNSKKCNISVIITIVMVLLFGVAVAAANDVAKTAPLKSVQTSSSCIQCHSKTTPGVVADWKASQHSKRESPAKPATVLPTILLATPKRPMLRGRKRANNAMHTRSRSSWAESTQWRTLQDSQFRAFITCRERWLKAGRAAADVTSSARQMPNNSPN